MDLQSLFTLVCNMTITGSVVIGAVLAARLVLRKAPRGFACALWLVVLFRLLCPVSLRSPVSVLTLVDAPAQRTPMGMVEYVESPVRAPVETMYADPSLEAEPVTPTVPQKAPTDWHLIASHVWAAGALILIAYGLLSYVNLKRKLRESVPLEPGIREADGIRSPFVLGFFRPVIYLPSGMGAERDWVLLHERSHIRHGDHLVKGLFWLAVCLHWFNPLVWLAFRLWGRDLELRCDETVLKALGPGSRSDYAQSLLRCAAGERLAPTPLAFSEGDAGRRIRHVLGWKRRKLWMLIPAAALCLLVAVLTACNPGNGFGPYFYGHRYQPTAVLGREDPSGCIYFLREDGRTLVQVRGDVWEEFGTLQATLFPGFELNDDGLEEELRRDVDQLLRIPERDIWLLQKEDGTLYLIQGADRVLRLDRIHKVRVRVQTDADFGSIWDLPPLGQEEPPVIGADNSTVLLTGAGTLVFTTSGEDDTLTVREEYHQVQSDGSTRVFTETHVLDRTRDYGYELPISRREDGEHQMDAYAEDWAVYTVILGANRFDFQVSFPPTSGPQPTSQPGQTKEVTFSENGGTITLMIPEGWDYEISSFSENEYSAGISFWPSWYQRGKLRLEYYPDRFAVCGTGLETVTGTLAGQEVTFGTYDGRTLWEFISFGEYFAVWGEGHELWWNAYGEQAMEILNSARFSLKTE